MWAQKLHDISKVLWATLIDADGMPSIKPIVLTPSYQLWDLVPLIVWSYKLL